MFPNFFNKNRKQLFLFDMDGVLAEHIPNEDVKARNNEQNLYANKRPIKSIIKIVKEFSNQKNVTIGILSSCNYQNQYEQKLEWLKKNVPFVNLKYVFIIIWTDELAKGSQEQKGAEKAKIILNLTESKIFDDIFLIEDRHEFIKSVNKLIPNCAHHLSEILD
ncbi:MAG: hypothetical protein IJ837_00440 [Clostridia bacterium]|nr:hypothetical protein [Clostridia bacterium]